MKLYLALAAVCLFFVPAARASDDDLLLPKLADLIGKWELTDAAAGIPKGSTFEFQKEGKLTITAEVDGKKQTFDFKYELKGRQLRLTTGDKTDTTEVNKLELDEKMKEWVLECKDKDGTKAKFKKVK